MQHHDFEDGFGYGTFETSAFPEGPFVAQVQDYTVDGNNSFYPILTYMKPWETIYRRTTLHGVKGAVIEMEAKGILKNCTIPEFEIQGFNITIQSNYLRDNYGHIYGQLSGEFEFISLEVIGS